MTTSKILIILFLTLSGLLHITSCKEECPPNGMAFLDSDTAVVPYTGLETLKFMVKDTLGNTVDTVIYIGKGKTKYIGDSKYETGSGYEKCSKGTDMEAMDFTYQNVKDPNETLIITVTQDGFDSKLNFLLTTSFTATNSDHFFSDWFWGYTSNFNAWETNFHDTITIMGTTYFNVIHLNFTPHKNSGKKILTIYFGKSDGVILLEETSNRSWHKIN